MNVNYYSVLGVKEAASFAEIKRAYRTMVKKYHPDINSDGAARFAKITAAYTVLSNPEKRREYDKKGTFSLEKKNIVFVFREFKKWLFGLDFLHSLFGLRKLSQKHTHTSLDNNALLQRVLYSTNPHVRLTAVRALFYKNDPEIRHDLLRLLYSEIPTELKEEIVRLTSEKPDNESRRALDEIASSGRDIRLSGIVRRYLVKNQSHGFSATL